MIAGYNTSRVIYGILSALGSLIGYGAAWLFFRYMPAFVAHAFGLAVPVFAFTLLAIAILALITWSGYRTWKKKGGFYGYHQSSLYLNLGEDTASAVVTGDYVNQVTGPAHVLSQLFLAGPLMALRSISHFRNLIKPEPGLEDRLKATLARLQVINKWQGLHEHPSDRREILLLAQMDKIDFSAAKGNPRFKASRPES